MLSAHGRGAWFSHWNVHGNRPSTINFDAKKSAFQTELEPFVG
jgi:hypothetical protein